ncbi:MAG: putative Ig domain-containing protein, partial [Chloroflexota bacterium]
MMEMIDNVARGASSKAARRGRAVALVAAASLVLALLGLAQAPAASALTGPISPLPSPWNIGYLAKIVPTQLTPSGALVTYTVQPALPPGITLSASGLFSGTPNAISPSTLYTITATSSDPADLTPVLTMPLTLAVVPTLVVPTGTIFGSVGSQLPALYTIKAEGFTAPTYTFNPPMPWLSIDAKGGLSGVPQATGAVTTTVTASETGVTGGSTVSATLNFSIAPAGATPPPAGAGLTPATQAAVGTVGVALSPALASFPSSATTKYTVTPDITLASGLTFSTTSGLVSGSPTKSVASGTSFLIEQRDVTSNAVLASSSLNLTVNGSLGATQVVRVVAGANLTSTVPFGPTAATAAGLGAGVTFSVLPALP